MSSLTQLSLALVPAHKETSTETSPGTYATQLQKHETVKSKSFTYLSPFNNPLFPTPFLYGNEL